MRPVDQDDDGTARRTAQPAVSGRGARASRRPNDPRSSSLPGHASLPAASEGRWRGGHWQDMARVGADAPPDPGGEARGTRLLLARARQVLRARGLAVASEGT